MRSNFITAVSSATWLIAAALGLGGCVSYSPVPAQPASVMITPAPTATVLVPVR
jgi:hypothetical protein